MRSLVQRCRSTSRSQPRWAASRARVCSTSSRARRRGAYSGVAQNLSQNPSLDSVCSAAREVPGSDRGRCLREREAPRRPGLIVRTGLAGRGLQPCSGSSSHRGRFHQVIAQYGDPSQGLRTRGCRGDPQQAQVLQRFAAGRAGGQRSTVAPVSAARAEGRERSGAPSLPAGRASQLRTACDGPRAEHRGTVCVARADGAWCPDIPGMAVL